MDYEPNEIEQEENQGEPLLFQRRRYLEDTSANGTSKSTLTTRNPKDYTPDED
jgi:hypothetical protein